MHSTHLNDVVLSEYKDNFTFFTLCFHYPHQILKESCWIYQPVSLYILHDDTVIDLARLHQADPTQDTPTLQDAAMSKLCVC
jgi:hypothetical protein